MKTDIFHKLIAVKFAEKKKSNFTNIIKRAEARKIMYLNHIPLDMHNDFLGEMEDLNLIKLKDKQNIEILE